MEDKRGSDVKMRKDVLSENAVLSVNDVVKTDTAPDKGHVTDRGARSRSLEADDRRSSGTSTQSSGSKSLSRRSSKRFSVQFNDFDNLQHTISQSKADIEASIQEVLNIRNQSATVNRIQNVLSARSHGTLANPIQSNIFKKSHGALANPIQANMSAKSQGALVNTIQSNILEKSLGALDDTIEDISTCDRAAGFASPCAARETDVLDPLLEYRRNLIGTRDGNYIKRLYREEYNEVFGLSEKSPSRTSRSLSNSQKSETLSSSGSRSRRSSQEPSTSSKSSGKRRKRAIISEKLFYMDWFRKLVVREHKFMFPNDKPLYPKFQANLFRKG